MFTFTTGLYSILFLSVLLPLVAICLAFPYIALRIRDSVEPNKDPQLGLKSAYYLLFSSALLLVLLGLTFSSIDLMNGMIDKGSKREKQQQQAEMIGVVIEDREGIINPAQRIAGAVVISGLLFTLIFMLLIKASTNDKEFPAVKRLFAGGRFAFAGIVCMLTMTALAILAFQKEAKDKDMKEMELLEMLLAILIVWLPTFLVHFFVMRFYSSKPYYAGPAAGRAQRQRDYVDD